MAADTLTEIELSETPDLAEGLLVAGHTELTGTDHEPEHIPLFYAGSIAVALVDARGRVSRASPAFEAMGGAGLIERDMVARVQKGGEPLAVTVELPGTGGAPDSAIFLYAPASRAAGWRLPGLIPTRTAGAWVHAIGQPAEGAALDEAELLESAAERLTCYKLPRSIEFTSEPLRDEAGKVRRAALGNARLGTAGRLAPL